jgi:Uma2 family endonuclease
VADIAATCASLDPHRQAIKDPFLVVEILSPSTERHDRRVKLPAYRQI